MEQDNFDRRMEDWAANETEAAPELRPTAEMYRLVESKKSQVQKSWFQSRWVATAGVALTALVVLIIAGLIISERTTWFGPTPVQQIAFVEQRKGPGVHPESPDKGKGRGDQSFQQLSLQVYRGAAGPMGTFDLRIPQQKPIAISAKDDFRLLIQPAQPRYLYIYLVSPDNDYQVLHPENEFNPLHPIITTLLPTPPNWFYISGKSGSYRLLMITATRAIPELDELYNQYLQRSAGPDSETTQRALSEYLESLTTDSNENLGVWELTLILQDED